MIIASRATIPRAGCEPSSRAKRRPVRSRHGIIATAICLSDVAGLHPRRDGGRAARACRVTVPRAASARTPPLAALPPLAPRAAPGPEGRDRAADRLRRCARARATRADAACAQAACSPSSAPTRSRRTRLADEIAWFAPDVAHRRAARLGDAALRPLLAAPGPRLGAPRDALPHHARRMRRRARRRRTTALYRLAPPSFLAALHVLPEAGRDARRRRAARAARARRLHARHAGGLAGRVQRARRPDRPLPDGQRAALPRSTSSATRSSPSAPSTSTRSARSTRCRDVRLLPAREFPLDDAGRTRFRSRFREAFEGDPSKSRALQGRVATASRRAASSTTCRCSSTRPRRSSTTCRRTRRSCAARRRRRGAVERFWQDTESRYRLLRGDKARPLLPPRELFLAAGRVLRRAQAARAHRACRGRRRRRDAPDAPARPRCRPCSVDRRADDPLAALKRYVPTTLEAAC